MEKVLAFDVTTSEEEIINKILIGERSLFEILIRMSNPLLYKICRSYSFNHQDAEDLMQEAYITAFIELSSFQSKASFRTWISKILINKCLYKLQYGYYKREQAASETISDTAPGTSNFNTMDTEQTVIKREFSQVLEKQLDEIPVIYKSVFVLREIEGFSIAETAELLNISQVNVKVRLNRAKTMLQKKIERFYSTAGIYDFNAVYCDAMVTKVYKQLNEMNSHGKDFK